MHHTSAVTLNEKSILLSSRIRQVMGSSEINLTYKDVPTDINFPLVNYILAYHSTLLTMGTLWTLQISQYYFIYNCTVVMNFEFSEEPWDYPVVNKMSWFKTRRSMKRYMEHQIISKLASSNNANYTICKEVQKWATKVLEKRFIDWWVQD